MGGRSDEVRDNLGLYNILHRSSGVYLLGGQAMSDIVFYQVCFCVVMITLILIFSTLMRR